MLSLLLVTVGCKSTPSRASDPASAANQTYHVRGVLVGIHEQRSSVDIQHETIADFMSSSGEKVGMPAMTMPFYVGSNVAANKFALGDKVAFTLEVRWGDEKELFIPEMTVLPAGTELQLK
jgi:Cu/Ag efflux protein CusF